MTNETKGLNEKTTNNSPQEKPETDSWFAEKLIDFMVSTNLLQRTENGTFEKKTVGVSRNHQENDHNSSLHIQSKPNGSTPFQKF